jgi:hypothetical protein
LDVADSVVDSLHVWQEGKRVSVRFFPSGSVALDKLVALLNPFFSASVAQTKKDNEISVAMTRAIAIFFTIFPWPALPVNGS